MKMIYRQNKNTRNSLQAGRRFASRQKRSKIIFAALLLAFALYFLQSESGKRFVARVSTGAALPVWKASNALSGGAESVGVFLSSKRTLADENMRLRDQVRELEKDLLGFNAAVSENIDLKKMLGRDEENEERIVLAGALSRSSDLPFDTLHVDAGERQGVRAYALVLASFSGLGEFSPSSSSVRVAAGEVVEVFPSTSKVRLYSSVGETTQVFLGPDNIAAELSGAGNGTFTAELPKDLDIEKGDPAVLPGAEGYFVALVEATEVDLSQAFQLVYLRTPFNPTELRYVGILSKSETGE